MFLHTRHQPGPCKRSSCATFTFNSHWGRAATGNKKSCVYAHRVALIVSDSLQPCRLWPVRLLCQRRRCPGKNTGAYWPILVAIPSRALYFLLPYPPTPLSTWCCQNPCNPSSCTTSTPHRGKPKSSRAASRANPSGQPTYRGRNKTTVETQGWCG